MELTTNYYLMLLLMLLMGFLWYVRSRRIEDVEPIRSILDLAAIPSLRKAIPQLNLEVARARRLTHSLSVIVIRGDFTAQRKAELSANIKPLNNNKHLEAQARQLNLQEFSDCSRAFRDQLREVDCVAFDSVRDQFIIVLPGTGHTQANDMIDRISRHLGPRIANHLATGVAEYPADGLFLEDLIEYSEEQIARDFELSDMDVEVSV